MIKLPAGLQFQKFPRVAAYAMLAALVTTALFAADGAYRWYRDPGTQVAALLPREQAPLPREQSEAAPEPAPVETQPADPPPQVLPPMPEREIVRIEEQVEDRSATAEAPNPTSGSISNPAGGDVPSAASASVEVAPRQVQPKPSRQLKRQQVRRLPAKQAARERARPRRPAQAEKPNVYWERDTQLGFAPQIRKRTCNPATGHMPMQCYYPREGRERFPAKPLN
jgi:hypothetical protein